MYFTHPVGGQDGSGGSFWTSSALGRSLSRLDYNGGRGEGRVGESPLVMRRRTEELCARWDGLALDIDEILEAPIDSSLHLMPTGGRMSQPYVQSSAQHGVLPLGESAEPLHLFHTIRNRKHVLHCYELLLMRTLEEDPDLWQRLCDTFGFCSECEAEGSGGCPPLKHVLHTATKDSFKVNSISPDLWFLAIALKESKDKLIHFIRSEGPKRKLGLPGKHLTSSSFLSSYLSAFNFVELNLDSIFRYGEPSLIPSEVFRCVNVRTLSLRHNFLEVLPPDIGRLAKLERLFLTNNKLQNKSIPFTIAFCPALQELYIDNNLLDALPGVLLRLSSLERVHRHGNHNYFKATFMWYHTDINDRILECPGEPESASSSPPSLMRLSGLAVIRSRMNFFASPFIPNRVKDYICSLCDGLELCSACSAARPTTAPSYKVLIEHQGFDLVIGHYNLFLPKVFTFKNPYLGNTCVPFQHWACSLACAREVEIPARREQLQDRKEQDRQYERWLTLRNLLATTIYFIFSGM